MTVLAKIAFYLLLLGAFAVSSRSQTVEPERYVVEVIVSTQGTTTAFVSGVSWATKDECEAWLQSYNALESLMTLSLAVLTEDNEATLGEPVCKATNRQA